MPSKFLEIKRQARRIVHQNLRLSAFWFAKADTLFANPVPLSARLHYDYDYAGDLPGTSFSYAERSEQTAIVAIVYTADAPVMNQNDIISFDRGEAFKIDHLDPPDDETVKVHLVRIKNSSNIPKPS